MAECPLPLIFSDFHFPFREILVDANLEMAKDTNKVLCGLKEIPKENPMTEQDRFKEALSNVKAFIEDAGVLHPTQFERVEKVERLLKEYASRETPPKRDDWVLYCLEYDSWLYTESIQGYATWSKNLDESDWFEDKKRALHILEGLKGCEGLTIIPCPESDPKGKKVEIKPEDLILEPAPEVGKHEEKKFAIKVSPSYYLFATPEDKRAQPWMCVGDGRSHQPKLFTNTEAVAVMARLQNDATAVKWRMDRAFTLGDLTAVEWPLKAEPIRVRWVIKQASQGLYLEERGGWTRDINGAYFFLLKQDAVNFYLKEGYSTSRIVRAEEYADGWREFLDHMNDPEPVKEERKYGVRIGPDAFVCDTSNKYWTWTGIAMLSSPRKFTLGEAREVLRRFKAGEEGSNLRDNPTITKESLACVVEISEDKKTVTPVEPEKKYVIRTHNLTTSLTAYWGGPYKGWTQDITKAVRYDAEHQALDAVNISKFPHKCNVVEVEA